MTNDMLHIYTDREIAREGKISKREELYASSQGSSHATRFLKKGRK
jgi:hypothetical protein